MPMSAAARSLWVVGGGGLGERFMVRSEPGAADAALTSR